MSDSTPKIDRREMAQSTSDPSATQRQCSICGEMKEDFSRGRQCRDCYRQRCRDYYYANRPPLKPRPVTPTPILRARHKATAYQRRYNITLAQRDEMLAEQGDACAICRTTESPRRDWSTDHDHECCAGKGQSCGECIRGILCFRCNTLLGHARDSIETLRAAVDYLEKWEARK